VPRSEWELQLVGDCMIPRERVPVLDEDDAAVDALAELSESELNRGIVLEDEELTGIVSITDLARALEIGMPGRRVGRAA
jgi:CBS domain-containing protein